MKKFLFLTGLITLLLSLSGCLGTLYPLFTEKDLVYDARIIGTWKEKDEKDNKENMKIEKASKQDLTNFPALQHLADKAYIVSLQSKETKLEYNNQSNTFLVEQKFIAFLTKVGTGQYLDFFPIPTDRQLQYNALFTQHFTGMHSFYRIEVRNDRSIELSQLAEEYLKDLIRQKRVRIQHEVGLYGSYLITAPTSELQQYVLKYGDVPEAYEGSTLYTKM